MRKFAGVLVAAAAKDEAVTAVIAIAVRDDGVAFGEATMVLDGRQAGVVGFFEGAAECFLEDGVPRFTLGVFGCGWDLLTTAFDRWRRELVRWSVRRAFVGVNRNELLGKPGCGDHVDVGSTDLVVHHVECWEAGDVLPGGIRHFSLCKLACLEVENPQDGCSGVWRELVDNLGRAFAQGFNNVEAFFAQRARCREDKL